jgi:DNA-binding NarL/FixJ family response regulator
MKNNGKKRVLLVDDHPLTRKGMGEAIIAEEDLEVCGEAEGWREALELIKTQNPDIVILDLNLKDGNGWNLLDNLKPLSGRPPVLVLSVCDENVYAERLLRAGAQGYLMKDTSLDNLVKAIRKILTHQVAVSDAIATSLINRATLNQPEIEEKTELNTLSDREIQVMELLCSGINNLQIAERMGISPKTVGTYKARLMEKLGVRTTPELLIRLKKKWLS